MKLSHSSVESFRRCEQQYQYRYVRGLRRKVGSPAPTLGNVLHTYLAAYYKDVQKGLNDPEDSHLVAKLACSVEHYAQMQAFSNIAFMTGSLDVAKEFEDMPRLAENLIDRYFSARGRPDADRYEVLLVEEKLEAVLRTELDEDGNVVHILNGRLDMITRDRATDLVALWEHKSRKYTPSQGVRLRDYQTIIYSALWEALGDVPPIDQIIWNYIRTKPPTEPEVLKNGTLSKKKNIDTTWSVYAEAIKNLGLRTSDYLDMRQRLEPRELTVYFPRYESETLINRDLLLDDVITTGDEMEEAEARWRDGVRPVRNFSPFCDHCDYLKLCNAAITGGDEDDLIRMMFDEQPQQPVVVEEEIEEELVAL
jgi:bacterioferritin (cytochrome b1)